MTTGTTIGTTEPLRLRHEVKHQISPQEDLVLASRLGKLFPRDGHAGPDGSYRVTSLYFDTPYDTALREKLDGVDRREKFPPRGHGGRPGFFQLVKKIKGERPGGKRSPPPARAEGGGARPGGGASGRVRARCRGRTGLRQWGRGC